MVAAGRDGWGGTFARDPARSPHQTSPRLLVVGLFDGINLPTETDLELTVVPGVAEVFHIRFRSFHGVTSQIAIGAIPDGPLGEPGNGYAKTTMPPPWTAPRSS